MKKGTLAQVFSCEFCEICKNIFFTEHLRVTASAKKFLELPELNYLQHFWKGIEKMEQKILPIQRLLLQFY